MRPMVPCSAPGTCSDLPRLEVTRSVTEPLRLDDRLAIEARTNAEVFSLPYDQHVQRVFRHLTIADPFLADDSVRDEVRRLNSSADAGDPKPTDEYRTNNGSAP